MSETMIDVTDSGATPGAMNRRTQLAIVIAAVSTIVLAVAAVAVVLYVQVFSKLGGADSPEAAVEQLLAGIENKDPVAVLGVIASDEMEPWTFTGQNLDFNLDVFEEWDSPELERLVEATVDSFEISFSNVAIRTIPQDTGLTMVSLIDGSIDMDVNAIAFADSYLEFLSETGIEFSPTERRDIRIELIDGVNEIFPTTVFIEDMMWTDESTGRDQHPFLMTVEIDGNWYVSPLMTIGEVLAQAFGSADRGAMPLPEEYADFASPEAAVEGFMHGLEDFVRTGEVDSIATTLSVPEHRFLNVYGPSFFEEIDTSSLTIRVEHAEFSEWSRSSTVALVAIDRFEIRVTDDWDDIIIGYDGDCLYIEDLVWRDTFSVCLGDYGLLRELGLDQPLFMTTHTGHGWGVNYMGSGIYAYGTMLSNLLRMQEEGLLDDERHMEIWFEEFAEWEDFAY